MYVMLVAVMLMKRLLSFPAGKHDDCVDALGLIGQLLDTVSSAAIRPRPKGKRSTADIGRTFRRAPSTTGLPRSPLPGRYAYKRWRAVQTEHKQFCSVGPRIDRRTSLSDKTLAVLLAAAVVGLSSVPAASQSGGSSGGASGGGGTSGTSSGATGGAGGAGSGTSAAPGSSVPSGTGPTPAPTPGQSFTFPSNSGTPGTGTTDNRVPSGTGPTPAPTPGQSTVAPKAPGSETSGSGASNPNRRTTAVPRDCSLPGTTAGGETTVGGTPRIAEDPNVPKQGSAGC